MTDLEPIFDFPNYSITKTGRIWSNKTKKWLKPFTNGMYLRVVLYKDVDGEWHRFYKYIHRLVLETFIGSCPDDMEACHNNGVQTDNRLKNLRWGTRKTNISDSLKHNTHVCLRQQGEANPNSRLNEEKVKLIFDAYHDGFYNQKDLAEYFNVSKTTIKDIVKKRTWRHIWTS